MILGQYIVIECYRKLDPDTYTGTGTANVSSSTTQVIGNSSAFMSDFIPGDEITINSQTKRILTIDSDASMNVDSAFSSVATYQTMTKTGISDVWNDRFLKQYATAMIKKQWGENLKKFGNVPMPGGVVLNGQTIWDEATAEIQKIEDEMQSYNILPSNMLIG
jgi:hypothetical protein